MRRYSPGRRFFFQQLFLSGLLCCTILSALVLMNCTLRRTLPELALTLSTPPLFHLQEDTLFTRGFLQALDQQIAFYQRSPSQRWRIGDRLITTTDLRHTLQTLQQLLMQPVDFAVLQEALHQHFDWYQVQGYDNQGTVLVTGYYAPLLEVRRQADERFRYPLYQRPPDLQVRLITEGGHQRKEVGRIEAGQWLPYFTREDIDRAGVLSGRGLEIAYSDDPLAVYMLQVQGSGYLQFPGEPLCLAHYAADNGYPYLSLGKILIEEGAIPAQEMSLHRIRYYFQERPSDLTFYLWRNKRYIFFRAVCPATAPVGSLGLSLTAGHSIATDPRLFPPGGLALLLTSQPVADAKGKLQGYTSLQRLVLNQDSGSAIQGPGRVDFFWGSGKDAEFSAGYMKQTGALFFLIQRKTPPSPLMVADK